MKYKQSTREYSKNSAESMSVRLLFVYCACSGLRDELITHLEETYGGVCVCVCLIVCDIGTSTMRHPGHEFGRCNQKNIIKLKRRVNGQ